MIDDPLKVFGKLSNTNMMVQNILNYQRLFEKRGINLLKNTLFWKISRQNTKIIVSIKFFPGYCSFPRLWQSSLILLASLLNIAVFDKALGVFSPLQHFDTWKMEPQKKKSCFSFHSDSYIIFVAQKRLFIQTQCKYRVG